MIITLRRRTKREIIPHLFKVWLGQYRIAKKYGRWDAVCLASRSVKFLWKHAA